MIFAHSNARYVHSRKKKSQWEDDGYTLKKECRNHTCTPECHRSWSAPSSPTALRTASSTCHTSTSSRRACGSSAFLSLWGRRGRGTGHGARRWARDTGRPCAAPPPCWCPSAWASMVGCDPSGAAAGSALSGTLSCTPHTRTCSSPSSSWATALSPPRPDLSRNAVGEAQFLYFTWVKNAKNPSNQWQNSMAKGRRQTRRKTGIQTRGN